MQQETVKGVRRSSVKRNDTASIEIVSAVSGLPEGLKIIVYGQTSEQFKEAQEANRKREQALLRRYKKKEEIPVHETDRILLEFIGDVTEGWEGMLDDADKPIPFTRREYIALLQDDPSILTQVALGIQDAANFTKGSPTP